MFKSKLDGGIKMSGSNFKRTISCILALVMILGAFLVFDVDAASAAPRTVNVENANGTGDTAVGVVTINNIMMANSNDLAAALINYTTVAANQAAVTVAAGTMTIHYSDMRLLLGAGSRQAYLTTGLGSTTPETRLVTLRTAPTTRTVGGASVLFVPFADTMRALGISVGRAGARIRETARVADHSWGTDSKNVVPTSTPIIARGATFQNGLNDVWFPAYNAISEDIPATTTINMEDGSPTTTAGFVYDRAFGIRIGGTRDGSGYGLNAVKARNVDFAGTDDPVAADQLGFYAMIPAAMGAVAVITNIPGIEASLNLTADIVADIYRVVVTRWDDARILRINPAQATALRGLAPQHMTIRPAYRWDDSGTTAIFTAWLDSAAPTANWPHAASGVPMRNYIPALADNLGFSGGSDMRTGVSQRRISNPANGDPVGSAVDNGANIGYIVRDSAIRGLEGDATSAETRIQSSRIRNRAGIFVFPTIEAQMAAGLTATNLNVHPVDSAHPGAYPVTGLTWYVIERDIRTSKPNITTVGGGSATTTVTNLYTTTTTIATTASTTIMRTATPQTGNELALERRDRAVRVFKDFIDWAIIRGFGDRLARDNGFAPLSPNIRRQIPAILNTIVP